jgi:hypothetical protein
MINPIQVVEQKVFNEKLSLRDNPTSTVSMRENNVDKSAQLDTYVRSKDKVEFNYDVSRYVQILKNMVVPPKDRFDASILLELELDGDITAQELLEMINDVNMKEARQETSKVIQTTTDDDSRGEEVSTSGKDATGQHQGKE